MYFRHNMMTHSNTHQGIFRPQSKNHKCPICTEAFSRRDRLNKHVKKSHNVDDGDLTALAENGPESEIGMEIIERIKPGVHKKEVIIIENADESGEIITPDEYQ